MSEINKLSLSEFVIDVKLDRERRINVFVRKGEIMQARPDMLNEASPDGLEVFQLTTEVDVSSSHIYMEAQIFTPDSKRFILHRSAHPHGSDPLDPEHKYLICDLENSCELIPITEEIGATAP